MINTDMRNYDYFTIGSDNEYGISTVSDEPIGTIKMAINISSQSTQENVNYKDCQYIGLTHAAIDDTYIIQYGDERLKVLYINPMGRYKQVFMVKL